MRISRLELKNFRTFSHLVLEDIPDLVVLVSPNGRGKSSILEAIAGIHELVRPYHQDSYPFRSSWQQRSVAVWPDHLSPPVKRGEHRTELFLEAEATGKEEDYLKSVEVAETTGKAHFVIEDGRYVTAEQSDNTIKRLFQYHNPSEGIGFIDYIRPIRFYPKRELGDFAADLRDESTRRVFSEFHQPCHEHNKFMAFKSFVVGAQLDDLSYLQETNQRRDSLEIFREVFNHLFAPKEFVGYRSQSGGRPQVVVASPYGEHDTDHLSDGEKEMLNVMAHLYRFRHLRNIILWDTPELHLNAALESRLYTALRKIAPNNQYWIATHSLEFIDTVPLDGIFVIQHDGTSAKIERASSAERRTRIAMYQDMGAKVGLQLVSSIIVFVEGKKNQSDKRILDLLVAESVPGVNFVASASCENVLAAGTRANGLLEEVCCNGDFLAIVDRDYRDDEEVELLEKQYKGRVFIWKVHEIENLFLNEEIIFNTLRWHDGLSLVEHIKTPGDIREMLLTAVKDRREWIASDWLAWELDRTFRSPSRRIRGENPKASLLQYVSRLHSHIQSVVDPDQFEDMFEKKLSEVDRLIDSGQWVERLPGKQILQKFLEPFSAVMINRDSFVRTATTTVREMSIEIPELKRLKAVIQGFRTKIGVR